MYPKSRLLYTSFNRRLLMLGPQILNRLTGNLNIT
jgi:hypothetical protein